MARLFGSKLVPFFLHPRSRTIPHIVDHIPIDHRSRRGRAGGVRAAAAAVIEIGSANREADAYKNAEQKAHVLNPSWVTGSQKERAKGEGGSRDQAAFAS